MSGSSLALDLVAPAYCTYPESYTTLGPEVADLATEIGFAPDPEQRMLLDIMYGANRDRSWSAFEFCVICSRQNLKTGLFKMAAIADAFLFHDELVTWTAHRFDTTEGAFRDIKKLIDGSDMLTRRVRKITEGNGDEEITLTDGCLIQFKARGAAGGRGKTGAKVFLDEGFALMPAHIGSLYPTTATLPGAQIRIGSSAGLVASQLLRDIRDRGRKGDAGLAYIEWSDVEPPNCVQLNCTHHRDTPGCCLDDRERWRRSNPAMGRRIKEERIATFRRAMPPAEFAREFLGWWDEVSGEAIIDFAKWGATEDAASHAQTVTAFGVEVALDRKSAAVGMCGPRADELIHLEVVERRPGVEWVLARCIELNAKWSPLAFVIDEGGPAASLIPDFENAGLPVLATTTEDVAAATAWMVDSVAQKTQRHGPQQELDAAVAGAKKRPFRDGGFGFGRSKSDVEIITLLTVTLAAWGHNQLGGTGASAYVL